MNFTPGTQVNLKYSRNNPFWIETIWRGRPSKKLYARVYNKRTILAKIPLYRLKPICQRSKYPTEKEYHEYCRKMESIPVPMANSARAAEASQDLTQVSSYKGRAL